MSRRSTRVALDRRSLLGGALLGGVGAVLGSRPVAAAPDGPRAAIVPPVLATDALTFRMLLTPVRVYDSRVGQDPDGTDPFSGAGDTRLLRNGTRRIDVSYVLGSESSPTGVLPTTAAVLLNLTAVGTAGSSGYLKVWAYGGTEPAISSLNWDHQSAIIANSVTTRHGSGYIMIGCGGPVGCSTNVIVDVLGYYATDVPLIT